MASPKEFIGLDSSILEYMTISVETVAMWSRRVLALSFKKRVLSSPSIHDESFQRTRYWGQRHIEQFLASDAVPCVSIALAERIVSSNVSKAVQTIDAYASSTAELPETEQQTVGFLQTIGLSKVRANRIHKDLFSLSKDHWHLKRLMSSVSIPLQVQKDVIEICKGESEALQVLESNPFQLCFLLRSIAFETADEIALIVGLHESNPLLRVEAAILYVMQFCMDEGKSFLTLSLLESKMAPLLHSRIEETVLRRIVHGLASQGPLEFEGGLRVYLKQVFEEEVRVSECIAKRVQWVGRFVESGWDAFRRLNLDRALQSAICAVDVSYGSEKDVFIEKLMEAAGVKYKGNVAYISMDRQDELKYSSEEKGMVVVDNAHLMCMSTALNLFETVGDFGQLVFIGDSQLLPSKLPGHFFRSLVHIPQVPKVSIEVTLEDAITSAIECIDNGRFPFEHSRISEIVSLDTTPSLYWVRHTEPMALGIVESDLTKLFQQTLPSLGFDCRKDVSVLTPTVEDALQLGKTLMNWDLPSNRVISVQDAVSHTFPVCIIVLGKRHYKHLSRQTLYSAFTRASKLCIVLGSKEAIGMSLKSGMEGNHGDILCSRVHELLSSEHRKIKCIKVQSYTEDVVGLLFSPLHRQSVFQQKELRSKVN